MTEQAQGLAQHIRDEAVRCLQALDKPITPEAIEAQGLWMLAMWHANSVHDYTTKDIAELFLGGLQPMTDLDKECGDITGDEEDLSPELIAFITEFL